MKLHMYMKIRWILALNVLSNAIKNSIKAPSFAKCKYSWSSLIEIFLLYQFVSATQLENSLHLLMTCFIYILDSSFSKGQLISKCPFGFIVWTKLPTKLFLNFCPEIFCTFLGASWKLFGASCRLLCLWYYILSPQEAQRASMKPPGSYKKTQGRNPEII